MQSGEIELDIDTLPADTVVKLYNLVVRGGRKLTRKVLKPKGGRKATGGANRKTMNEAEEAERIRRMEEQLASFNSQPSGQGMGQGYDSESSEDESSEEE